MRKLVGGLAPQAKKERVSEMYKLPPTSIRDYKSSLFPSVVNNKNMDSSSLERVSNKTYDLPVQISGAFELP